MKVIRSSTLMRKDSFNQKQQRAKKQDIAHWKLINSVCSFYDLELYIYPKSIYGIVLVSIWVEFALISSVAEITFAPDTMNSSITRSIYTFLRDIARMKSFQLSESSLAIIMIGLGFYFVTKIIATLWMFSKCSEHETNKLGLKTFMQFISAFFYLDSCIFMVPICIICFRAIFTNSMFLIFMGGINLILLLASFIHEKSFKHDFNFNKKNLMQDRGDSSMTIRFVCNIIFCLASEIRENNSDSIMLLINVGLAGEQLVLYFDYCRNLHFKNKGVENSFLFMISWTLIYAGLAISSNFSGIKSNIPADIMLATGPLLLYQIGANFVRHKKDQYTTKDIYLFTDPKEAAFFIENVINTEDNDMEGVKGVMNLIRQSHKNHCNDDACMCFLMAATDPSEEVQALSDRYNLLTIYDRAFLCDLLESRKDQILVALEASHSTADRSKSKKNMAKLEELRKTITFSFFNSFVFRVRDSFNNFHFLVMYLSYLVFEVENFTAPFIAIHRFLRQEKLKSIMLFFQKWTVSNYLKLVKHRVEEVSRLEGIVFNSDTLELITHHSSLKEEIEECIEESLRLLRRYYEELKGYKEKGTYDQLLSDSERIFALRKHINSKINAALKLGPRNVSVLMNKLRFKKHIEYALSKEINEVIADLKELINVKIIEDSLTDSPTSLINIFNGEAILLHATYSQDQGAKISYLSKVAADIFGFKKSEVIGKNPSMFIPRELNIDHDLLIKNFLNSNTRSFLKKNKKSHRMIGYDKEGNLLTMRAFLRVMFSLNSALSIVIMLNTLEKINNDSCCVLRIDGHISFNTELSIDKDKYSNELHNHNIYNVIPSLKEVLEERSKSIHLESAEDKESENEVHEEELELFYFASNVAIEKKRSIDLQATINNMLKIKPKVIRLEVEKILLHSTGESIFKTIVLGTRIINKKTIHLLSYLIENCRSFDDLENIKRITLKDVQNISINNIYP